MESRQFGTGSYALALDVVAYELAPSLNKRGAHVWIDEVGYRTFVIGFSCWVDGAYDELWSCMHDRLRSALRERVYREIVFRDYSKLAVSPADARAPRQGAAARSGG